MTVKRPHQEWRYHDVTVSTYIVLPPSEGEEPPRGEWTVDCGTCGESFLDRRRLGVRKTLLGARQLAERHLRGQDAHAKYLIAHPLVEEVKP